jgi:hypothetical protein
VLTKFIEAVNGSHDAHCFYFLWHCPKESNKEKSSLSNASPHKAYALLAGQTGLAQKTSKNSMNTVLSKLMHHIYYKICPSPNVENTLLLPLKREYNLSKSPFKERREMGSRLVRHSLDLLQKKLKHPPTPFIKGELLTLATTLFKCFHFVARKPAGPARGA